MTSTLRGMNSILIMNGGKRTKARFKARNVARKILGPVGLWLSIMLLLGSPIAGEAGRNLPWWTVWLGIFGGASTMWAVLTLKECPAKGCSGDLCPTGEKSEWTGAEIKRCSKCGVEEYTGPGEW